MFFLILSILASALIAVVMRLSSDKVRRPLGMLFANYLVCTVLGACYTDFRIFLPEEPGYFTALGLGIFNGFLYLSSFVLYQYNTRKNGIVLSSIFMKLGLLVPMVLSVLFFNEFPSLLQALGFLLAVIAIVLINYQKGSGKSRLALELLLLLLLGGCADAMSKVFQVLGTEALSDQFLLFTYGMAFLLCTCLVILRKEFPGKRELFFGALIGIPNFFSTKTMLAALTDISAVVAYPTFSVSTMLMVTLAGTVFFREKLTKNQWIALGIILVALALLNL